MAFRERHNGEGYYTADETNNRNAQRGAFVRNGGAVTVGASSSEVVLNIDAADIRVDGTDYSASSGQITLTENTTLRPRRDLVIARKGPTTSDPATFDALTGTPIDGDLLDRLQNSDQPEGPYVDDNGLPVHPPENIPHIQPPPFQGFRAEATLLAMVYVPPGAADSTDLATEYVTDLRMSGIGVDNVLRTGDVVPELEGYDTAANGAVQTTVDNTERYNDRLYGQLLAEQYGTALRATLADGEEEYESFYVPSDRHVELWSAGVVSVAAPRTGIEGFLQQKQDDGSWQNFFQTTSEHESNNDGTPIAEAGSDGRMFRWRLQNSSGTTRDLIFRYTATLRGANFRQ